MRQHAAFVKFADKGYKQMSTTLKNYSSSNPVKAQPAPIATITDLELQAMAFVYVMFTHVAVKAGYISQEKMVELTRGLLDRGWNMATCPENLNDDLKKVWDYVVLQVNVIGSPETPDAFVALSQAIKYAEMMNVQMRGLVAMRTDKKGKA